MTLSIGTVEPRGYLPTAMRIAGVAAVFFPLSMVLFTSLFTGAPTHRWLWLFMLMGLAMGAAMGLTFAAYLRGETRSVPAASEASFLPRLDVATAELGLRPVFRAPGYYSYKASRLASLAAGPLVVVIGEGRATIVGPKAWVRMLLERL